MELVLDLRHSELTLHAIFVHDSLELGSHDRFWVFATTDCEFFKNAGESLSSTIFGIGGKKVRSEMLGQLVILSNDCENFCHCIICSGVSQDF